MRPFIVALNKVRAVVTRAFARLAGSERAEYAGRCDRCGRGFARGTPLRWCVSGHVLHRLCVEYVAGHEVCPICGIYVSAFPASSKAS